MRSRLRGHLPWGFDLLMNAEEDPYVRAVLVGMLREARR